MEVITETTPQAVRDKIAEWLEYQAKKWSRSAIPNGTLIRAARELRNIPCVAEIIGDALPEGATITEAGALPDGSGFAVASSPLPADHWLYGSAQRPPMPFRMGKVDPRRAEFERRLTEAGRYAVRAATMSGRDNDFDPDALIQNLIVGACGYHTATGLSECDPDGNPKEPPPVFSTWDLTPGVLNRDTPR